MTDNKPVRAAEGTGAYELVVRKFSEMAAAIPDADDETGMLRILTQIAGAETPEELGAPWDTSTLDKIKDREIVVMAIRKRPSDFSGGLGMYLVLDAADAHSGEVLTITTGAASVVAQLVRAYDRGHLPLRCAFKVADRPSANGYYPQHLAIHGTDSRL